MFRHFAIPFQIAYATTIMALVVNQNPCILPIGCSFRNINPLSYFYLDNYMLNKPEPGIRCNIRKTNYKFEYDSWLSTITKISTQCKKWKTHKAFFELKLPVGLTLNDHFNLAGFSDFILYFQNLQNFFKGQNLKIKLTNLGRFDVSFHPSYQLLVRNYENIAYNLEIHRSRFEFVVNNKPIRTCRDLIDANVTWPHSMFNLIPGAKILNMFIVRTNFGQRTPICPLIFKNANIKNLFIWDMVNSFYKKNLLTFTVGPGNDSIDETLNSNIDLIHFMRTENIELNLKLLNPSVFTELKSIVCHESVAKIDPKIFPHLLSLERIRFEGVYFRKLIHKQGIDWIKAINEDLNANYSDLNEFESNLRDWLFGIRLRFSTLSTCEDTFPIEDFCLYREFPLDKMIYIFVDNDPGDYIQWLDNKLCCTFRYLIEIYEILLNINSNVISNDNIKKMSGFVKYYKDMPVCDFDKLLSRCVKSKFESNPYSKKIWDYSDWKTLNKWFQILSTSLTYPLGLFGILTNSIVVFLIFRKNNEDIFKGFKQYSYLTVVSICNILILIIEIFSWMSDCNDTLDILCPETRKLIVVQFFKIIFKETIFFAIQFMIQFAYMAFAFNRVSLIGKDPGNLVQFFSESSMTKYLLSCAFISIGLSVIKVFSFKVNYDRSDDEYPMNQDGSVSNNLSLKKLRRVLGTLNSTIDLLNHLVFVIANLTIDIYMVVRLKKTLNEKSLRMFGDNKEKNGGMIGMTTAKDEEKKAKLKKEIEDAVHNATKMVIVNSCLILLVKLPMMFMSIHKTIERFYFSGQDYYRYHKGFYIFYWRMFKMGFLDMIPDLNALLLVIYVSCQLFFYAHFDKKIKKAFRRLLKKPDE